MKKILLILIFFLALVLRFYKLEIYPALNADEAALGYNAYSLIETGLDEHRHPWPIHFQSFNDWKPGLTVYLIMPFIKLFGLQIMSVRFLPALLGALSVVLIYFLSNQLVKNNTDKMFVNWLPLSASLMLAISPWHIHFSRGAWEVNIATFFILLGLYILFLSLRKPAIILLGVVIFVASLYTYHSARLVTPLVVFGFFVLNWKHYCKYWKLTVVSVIFGILLVVPLVADLMQPESLSRAAGVGLFADPGPRSRIEEQRGEHPDYKTLPPKVLHNKATNYGLAFLDNWITHYQGEFLFLSGDEIQRNRVPETGQLYTIEILYFFFALLYLVKTSRENRASFKVIIWWLLIAPVASALTFQSPHALRSQNMIIPLTIFSALGMAYIFGMISNIKKRYITYALSSVFCLFILTGSARYLLMYYLHMAKEYPFSSQYGVSELVDYIQTKQSDYKSVIITDRYDQPYILFLFYLKYPPHQFQSEGELTDRDGFGFSTVRKFGKYEFRSIKFDEDRPLYRNSLLVGTDGEIPNEANIIQEVYGLNGYKYFEIVAN